MGKTSNGKRGPRRRSFLQALGAMSGSSMVYRAMSALGCLPGPTGCTRPDLPPGSGTGRRVLILGAGIAGMTAAYELSRAGYDCTILEATVRAGGRNRTARAGDVLEEIDSRQLCRFDDDEHIYLNTGPARIPYHHRNLLGYCREFGVALEVFTNDNRAAFFHGQNHGEPVVSRRLHTDTRGWLAELLAKATNRGALDEELTGVDKEAFLDMLVSFGDLSVDSGYEYQGSSRAGFRDRVNPGLEEPSTLELPEKLTLQQILGDDVFHDYRARFTQGINQNPTLFQPVGGMDRIARAFEQRVGHLIQYQAVVTAIENLTDGVRVVYEQAGDTHVAIADVAICAIPATVLRDIENNFRAEVRIELASMVYNNAVKIGIQARRRFWEQDLDIYAGITWTNQPITQVWYPATGYHRQKGIMLAAYTWDNSWDPEGTKPATNPFFQRKTPDERLAETLGELGHIHPHIAAEFENGISVAWGKVPFQRGGWADDSFGYQEHQALSEGDGNIYFAGEHVSFLHGWQEGAVLSAHAAVAAIAERVAAK